MLLNLIFLFLRQRAFWNDGTPVNGKEKFGMPLSEVKLRYVNIRPGECLVFHKNVLHISDPRETRRVAINFRVAICDEEGQLAFNNVKEDLYLKFKNRKMRSHTRSIARHLRSQHFRVGFDELA